MPTTVLIIGASGTVGRQVVKALDSSASAGAGASSLTGAEPSSTDTDTDTSTGTNPNPKPDIRLCLSSSRVETIKRWRAEGREAVLLDLCDPRTFASALRGIDRLFLLTGYTAGMLFQSKMLVDAAARAGVSHVVHLGVFSSGNDNVPHFAWHDLIETYIKASGMAWTNLHPNVILDSVLVGLDLGPPPSPSNANPGLGESETRSRTFNVSWGQAALGWISASDIGAVAAAVLREGPARHAGKDYGLSPEVLTGEQAAEILSETLGVTVRCRVGSPDDLAGYVGAIEDAGARMYMESAVQTMREGAAGRMRHQAEVQDDCLTVLGRPAMSLAEWASINMVVEADTGEA